MIRPNEGWQLMFPELWYSRLIDSLLVDMVYYLSISFHSKKAVDHNEFDENKVTGVVAFPERDG